MIYKAKSSLINMFLNGKLEDLYCPWVLIVNFENETITVEKRTWFFFGKDINIVAFRFIRSISIEDHLFGSDISIKVVGGWINANYLRKKDINNIKKLLIDYNQTKSNHIIFS